MCQTLSVHRQHGLVIACTRSSTYAHPKYLFFAICSGLDCKLIILRACNLPCSGSPHNPRAGCCAFASGIATIVASHQGNFPRNFTNN
jgi:hypothetical protein